MMQSEGRVAIVTGASRGIGRAVAERLGRDGAAVTVNYHSSKEAAEEVAKTITAAGGRAVAVRGDIGVPGDVRALFDVARSEFGDVVAFLAGDDARWVTGQTIHANGGFE